ncbi:MAG: cytochrome c [Deltaproteobacteria bacterium]|nr:cytochrome c [Deltaproteobacteria bacterium]MCW5807137.1 cytochrome c [Deltaproteobacteria bacterium]
MRIATGSIAVASLASLLIACTGAEGDDPPAARATWYQDVAPILANRCMSCHQDGGIAPFPLTDFASAKENAERILIQTDAGAMPPFDAREEADCTPRFGWVDDPRLSAAEKATLHAWVEDGHALGKVADIPAIPSSELPNVTRTLTPVEGFATAGDRDQFFCYTLDPGNGNQVAWLTGLQVNPDITEVVHHAVIFEVQAGAELDKLVADHGIGRPFDCSQQQIPGNFVVHIWTPGNQPMQTSSDIAVPILPQSKLVMQVHYHPAGTAHAPDRTSIDVRYSPVWPKKMYFVAAFGNAFQAPELLPGPNDRGGVPEFLIPKNVPDHREHMRITIPNLGDLTDVRLFSANPHMHLIGTHISGTIERPAARGDDPRQECLANGGWNFDWQRTYTYDAPLDKLPTVQQGDVIDIKCSWDNTIENPFVQRMLKDANLGTPIDVPLGEQTTNEMCLEIFGIAIPAPPAPLAHEAPAIKLPRWGLNMQALD